MLLSSALAISVTAKAQTVPAGYIVDQYVTSGLSQPTQMAFIGPNEWLICEKATGKVKRYFGNVFQNEVIDLPVNASSERGLLGIAVDPDFETNKRVYLYHSAAPSDGGTWQANKVTRFTYDTGTNQLVAPFDLITFPSDGSQANGPNHDGGILAFGPDKKLYIITGDLNRGRFSNPRVEQNTGSTNVAKVGGIHRLNTDGTIPSDNPFFADSRPEIQGLWAYGIRNSYGMAFDSLTGNLWFTENGPNVMDEINLAPKGMNSGWLKIMGPDSRNATYGENGNTAYNAGDLIVLPGSAYRDPEYSWLAPIGVTVLEFLNTPKVRDEDRFKMLVGCNNTGQAFLYELNASRDGFVLTGGNADKVADNATERNAYQWGTGFGVCTDIKIGPDGYVYVVSLNLNQVVRLRPRDEQTPPLSYTFRSMSTQQSQATFLSNLAMVDNRLAEAFTIPKINFNLPPNGIVFKGRLPNSVTSNFRFLLEASSSSPALVASLKAFNYVTLSFETVGSSTIGLNKQSFSYNLDPAVHLNANLECEFLLEFPGPQLSSSFTVRIDRAVWAGTLP
jgi:glucose/arabinose dehydrogenase